MNCIEYKMNDPEFDSQQLSGINEPNNDSCYPHSSILSKSNLDEVIDIVVREAIEYANTPPNKRILPTLSRKTTPVITTLIPTNQIQAPIITTNQSSASNTGNKVSTNCVMSAANCNTLTSIPKNAGNNNNNHSNNDHNNNFKQEPSLNVNVAIGTHQQQNHQSTISSQQNPSNLLTNPNHLTPQTQTQIPQQPQNPQQQQPHNMTAAAMMSFNAAANMMMMNNTSNTNNISQQNNPVAALQTSYQQQQLSQHQQQQQQQQQMMMAAAANNYNFPVAFTQQIQQLQHQQTQQQQQQQQQAVAAVANMNFINPTATSSTTGATMLQQPSALNGPNTTTSILNNSSASNNSTNTIVTAGGNINYPGGGMGFNPSYHQLTAAAGMMNPQHQPQSFLSQNTSNPTPSNPNPSTYQPQQSLPLQSSSTTNSSSSCNTNASLSATAVLAASLWPSNPGGTTPGGPMFDPLQAVTQHPLFYNHPHHRFFQQQQQQQQQQALQSQRITQPPLNMTTQQHLLNDYSSANLNKYNNTNNTNTNTNGGTNFIG